MQWIERYSARTNNTFLLHFYFHFIVYFAFKNRTGKILVRQQKNCRKAVVHQCKCSQTLKPYLETMWKVYVAYDKGTEPISILSSNIFQTVSFFKSVIMYCLNIALL